MERQRFQIGDIVYNKVYNTVGFIRDNEWRGEIRTDADGVVNVKDLEIFTPSKHIDVKIAPSTIKELKLKHPTLYGVFKTYKTGKYRFGKNVIIKQKRKYPELYRVAMEISEKTVKIINEEAKKTKSKAVYKAQLILENVVEILEESI